MTPDERSLVSELFDRLSTLESAPRDPEAERLIMDGLRRAPNATYALVQTVLVQDEALKRADARIQALEQELGPPQEQRQGGFLDNMRGALFGRRDEPRPGSVPSVPPVRQSDTRFGAGPGPAPGMAGGYPGGYAAAEPMRPGGSFLGTMAASAAGVIGGSLLLDGIRSMMGHNAGGAHAAFDPGASGGLGSSSPWSSAGGGGGQLARDAGLDDIGRQSGGGGGRSAAADDANSGSGYGLFGNSADDSDQGNDADQADDYDDGMDDGGFDSGGGGDE
jgi:uncharacterized protein